MAVGCAVTPPDGVLNALLALPTKPTEALPSVLSEALLECPFDPWMSERRRKVANQSRMAGPVIRDVDS